MKAEFRHVPPAELRNVWATIKPGLEITAKRAPGGWLVEDVYATLKANVAVLHLVIVDARYKGFLITQTLDSVAGKKLLLWIGYSDAGGDILADNVETIREWARNIGATNLQFQSPRKGWAKVAEKIGFEPVQVVYESDI